MIENLQDFAGSFPEWLQWFAVFLIAMVPFVESYIGTAVGVAIGLPPAVAASAAIAGNAVAVLIIVLATGRIRSRVARRDSAESASPRRQRIGRLFQRFGIPGVALLGHPTQISSAAMVGFGADQRRVLAWEVVSIVVYGVFVAVVAGFGLAAVTH